MNNPQLQKQSNSSGSRDTEPSCYYCKGKGHYVRDCRKKQINQQRFVKETNDEDNNNNHYAHGFIATLNVDNLLSLCCATISAIDENIEAVLKLGINDCWLANSGTSGSCAFSASGF
ncbi:hypothetical protein TKK_0007963 [Trichogramma kaykai]